MGPDCGTAIVGGIGLGFANRVRAGGIGLVGASGTGLQAIASHIHALGGGISHALGTGGRDLKAEVGAITARQSLDLLARDPATHVIVIVSKPPSPAVAAKLLSAAQAAGKPVVVDFIGRPSPGRSIGNVHFTNTLAEAAEQAVTLFKLQTGDWRQPAAGTQAAPGSLASDADRTPATAHLPPTSQLLWPDSGRHSSLTDLPPPYLRGLYSGGTLAFEAVLSLQTVLAPLSTNVPLSEDQRLADPLHSQAHTILDLGDDTFTVGRLHPMMDNELRLRRLRQEAADPQVGLILLDVVLGEGAHPDPAAELAPAVAATLRERHNLKVVVLVVGTDADPQGLASQSAAFTRAGALVCHTTAEAVEQVARHLTRPPAALLNQVALDRVAPSPFAAINVGLESFNDSLIGQGATVVHVDWKPPAAGNERLLEILAKRKKQG
jgi:FdrA protein